jgi:hypothetical protein
MPSATVPLLVGWRLVAEQAATIRDLRTRLDAEAEERRKLIAILTAPERRPWWRRWFR